MRNDDDKTNLNMRIRGKPIAIKERHSILFLGKGQIDVKDGAFVLIDKEGIRIHIPVGGIACLMLEPGTRITHDAVALAAEVGCLLVWVGDAGVRLYASGQPGGARSDKLLYQAKLALDDELRLKVVRAMYKFRFGSEPPQRRSIDQLRGIEGARVRELYKIMARQHNVPWKARIYDPKDWKKGDTANQCISAANHCLYGICEAAILAAGYAPAIGFIHTGKPQSFVYDIADLFKFETTIPIAFKAARENQHDPVRHTRILCRNSFREHKILKRIIPTIEEILKAGGIEIPKPAAESVPAAIPNEEGIGDDGHRN
jgi:CRISPR-associated protein Cas1